MSKPLVIVESPAKAKTLGRFLGRELQRGRQFRPRPRPARSRPARCRRPFGTRSGAGSASTSRATSRPTTSCRPTRSGTCQALKTALKDASEVLLATDPDREGESISWHLREVLKPEGADPAVVFHEITEEAVREAMAQRRRHRREARGRAGGPAHPGPAVRLHPVAGALEEGADRLVRRARPERGRPADRRAGGGAASVPRAPTTGTSRRGCAARGASSPRTLVRVGDRRVATGQDFDSTGQLTGSNVRQLDEADRTASGDRAARAICPWARDPRRGEARAERPAPPFTTSTLTQEAARKLGLFDQAHDGHRAAAVPGRGDRRRADGRPHHLPPHRLDHALRAGAARGGALHPGDVRRRVLHRARAATRPG